MLNTLLIHRDAPVGTNNATRRTADAVVRAHCLHVGIAMHIHSLLGQCNYILRTCDDTKLTTLAPLCIHNYRSFYFCHITKLII